MRAPEPLRGLRVVASASALDALAWPDGVIALRVAPDELLVIGKAAVALGDEPAIIEDERGLVGWWLTLDEWRDHVREYVDWPLPASRPALAQGLVAGVPAKVWLTEDRVLLLCASAYAHELVERLR